MEGEAVTKRKEEQTMLRQEEGGVDGTGLRGARGEGRKGPLGSKPLGSRGTNADGDEDVYLRLGDAHEKEQRRKQRRARRAERFDRFKP